MRTKEDYTKQLYCALYTAHDRLRTSRILYNETHDVRWLNGIKAAKSQMEKIANKITEDYV